MLRNGCRALTVKAVFLFFWLVSSPAWATAEAVAVEVSQRPWWFWPLVLLVFCFILGIVAVLAGVGGGVLYVPLVSGFFPFHLDFVRGAGLLVALAGALAAGPGLLRRNLANLRLALPVALIASVFAIVGAFLGLAYFDLLYSLLVFVVLVRKQYEAATLEDKSKLEGGRVVAAGQYRGTLG